MSSGGEEGVRVASRREKKKKKRPGEVFTHGREEGKKGERGKEEGGVRASYGTTPQKSISNVAQKIKNKKNYLYIYGKC